MNLEIVITLCKIVIITSIAFVWVVRYSNIVDEFKHYQLPNWFRDIMGIIKLSSCGMFITGEPALTLIACIILSTLMFAAMLMHIKVKHTVAQMVPSFSLLCLSLFIGFNL